MTFNYVLHFITVRMCYCFVVEIFLFRKKNRRILHPSFTSPVAAAPRAIIKSLMYSFVSLVIVPLLFTLLPRFFLLLFWENGGLLELVKRWHRTLSMAWCLQTLSSLLNYVVLYYKPQRTQKSACFYRRTSWFFFKFIIFKIINWLEKEETKINWLLFLNVKEKGEHQTLKEMSGTNRVMQERSTPHVHLIHTIN
jgi:hypothetical protein